MRKPLVVLYTCSYIAFLSIAMRWLLPPLYPLIENDLKMTHAHSGMVMSASSLGYGLVGLFVGLLASYFGLRGAILASILTFSGATVLEGLSLSFGQLFIFSFFVGFGAGAYFPLGLLLITSWFKSSLGKKTVLGKALGVYEAGSWMGNVVTPLLCGAIASKLGWRMAVFTFSLLGFMGAVIFSNKVEDVPFAGISGISLRGMRRGYFLFLPPFVLTVGGGIGLLTMLQLFFYHVLLIGVGTGSLIISLSRIGGVLGSLIGGRLSEKLDRWRILLFSASGIFIIIALLLYIPIPSIIGLLLFLQAVCSALMFVTFWLEISRIVPAYSASQVIGLHQMCGVLLGGATIPYLMGQVADSWGLKASFLIPALLALINLIYLYTVGERYKAAERKGKKIG